MNIVFENRSKIFKIESRQTFVISRLPKIISGTQGECRQLSAAN